MAPVDEMSSEAASYSFKKPGIFGFARDLRLFCVTQAAEAAGLFLTVVAAFVLIGWVFDIAVLKSISPNWISMKANTALSFACCGMAIILIVRGTSTGAKKAGLWLCLLVPLILSCMTLLQYLMGINLGIDELIFEDKIGNSPTIHPGRMAPLTAVNFCLLIVAMLLLRTGSRCAGVGQVLAAIVFFTTFFALFHYLYGVTSFFRVPRYTQLALHTIVLFLVSSLGVVLVRPEIGFGRLLVSSSAGGMIIRTLLPAAVLLPAAFGWLRLQGENKQLYDSAFGLALMVLFSTASLAAIIVAAAVITDKMERERGLIYLQLQDALDRLNLALSAAGIATWHWDFSKSEYTWDDHVAALLGLPDEVKLGNLDDLLSRVHLEDLERLRTNLSAALTDDSEFVPEFRVCWPDGSIHVLATQSKIHREPGGVSMTGVFSDITERKRIESQLLQEAYTDPVTRLPNRAAFLQHLQRAIAHERRRGGYRFAVLFLDLDRFKNINDTLGHSVGDQLLFKVGERLAGCLRPGDIASRFGGDEFTILLDDLNNRSDASDAAKVARKVQASFEQPFFIAGQSVHINTSIGVALSHTGYVDAETILRDADAAMYQAKSLGRGLVEVFDKKLYEQVARNQVVETQMRAGLERGEFYLEYQPIVELASGRIMGFEALARWKNAHLGAISPGEFIPLAEDSGFISSLGWFVFDEACAARSRWKAAGLPWSVSINVSARQFNNSDFAGKVVRTLERFGLVGKDVKLEITERIAMESVGRSDACTRALKEQGIQLHVDDFGTGYSSLSSLAQLPIDALKIDRSFVAGLGKSDQSNELCRTIIALAMNMEMECIAEGVETKEQLALLLSLGCIHAQGYLFSKPLSEQEAFRMASVQL